MFATSKGASSSSPMIADSNFNYDTLLLNGDGVTNGANNGVFLDSSNNNFSITTNGANTTQGSFSPFGSDWSVYQSGNGTGSYLPYNSSMLVGTGPFTIEAWIFPLATQGTQQHILANRTYNATGTGTYAFYIDLTTNYLKLDEVQTPSTLITSTTAVTPGVWQHVAISRDSSSNMRFFINGVLSSSVVNSTFNFSSTNPIKIGINDDASHYSFIGYLSNVRFVVGTAVYTSNFTPSTTPLNYVANTAILTHQSSRFVDNSPSNSSFTFLGTPTVQRFSPFAPAVVTPTSYSVNFNGSTDYLITSSGSGLTIGAGQFTFEFWIYHNVSGASEQYVDSTTNGFSCAKNTGNFVGIAQSGVAGLLNSTIALPIGQWAHVAVTRNSSNLVTIWINGVSGGSSTITTNFTNTSFYIGRNQSSAIAFLNGYISNMRLLNGTALYTTAFTPPTAPLTAVTNTVLLTCQSPTFVDNSTNAFTITPATTTVKPTLVNPFTPTVGTVAPWTANTYSGSGYFDGSTSYLTVPVNASLGFGTGNFTWEAWIFPIVLANYIYDTNASGDTSGTGRFNITVNAGVLQFRTDAGTTILLTSGSTLLVANSWQHIAITRSGTTGYMFINGALVNSATVTTNFLPVTASGTNRPIIGSNGYNLTGTWSGYISNLRVLNGTALYTSNFVPSTTPLAPVANTVLLLNNTNAGIVDYSMQNDVITIGSAQANTIIKKYGTGSMYFNGSSYLASPYNPSLNFTSEDFTVEAWIYLTSSPSTSTPYTFAGVWTGTNSTSNWIFTTGTSNGGNIRFGVSNGTTATFVESTTTLSINNWIHVAASRQSGTLRLFANGTSVYSGSLTGGVATTTPLSVGAVYGGSFYYTGYIDDFRITNGVARYTTAFTPPTSALSTF